MSCNAFQINLRQNLGFTSEALQGRLAVYLGITKKIFNKNTKKKFFNNPDGRFLMSPQIIKKEKKIHPLSSQNPLI